MPAATAPPGVPARIVLIGDSFATRFDHYCRAINGGLDPRLISLSVVGKRGEQLGCREKLVKIRDVTENDESKNYKSEN